MSCGDVGGFGAIFAFLGNSVIVGLLVPTFILVMLNHQNHASSTFLSGQVCDTWPKGARVVWSPGYTLED